MDAGFFSLPLNLHIRAKKDFTVPGFGNSEMVYANQFNDLQILV